MVPGPTCAPTTAPSSTTARRRRRPAARCAAARPAGGPVERVQVVHGDIDSPGAGRVDRPHRKLLDPGDARGTTVRTFSIGSMCPRCNDEDRLDRQRRPEQGRRRADPAAAAQVLQGVDVEQHRRRLAPASAPRRQRSSRPRPAGASSQADRTAKPIAMPSERESTTSTGTGDSAGGELRRLHRAGHVRGQVDRHDRVGSGGGGRLVGLEEDRRRGPGGAHVPWTGAAPPPPRPW